MLGPVETEVVTGHDRLVAVRRSGLLREAQREQLDRLAALAAAVTGSSVSLISIVDRDRQVFAGQFGLTAPQAEQGETPLTHSVCSAVVERRAPLMLDHLGDNPVFADHPARRDLSVEAYCGVPIRDPDGQVLGSFCVINHASTRWSAETVELLERLSRVVTDIVAMNRSYQTLVSDLQDRLLPVDPPPLASGTISAFYRPVSVSEPIGGDFYDWNVRPDGSVDLVVGDVVGHGVGSTQAAAQLRAAVRAVVTGSSRSPADVISRVSQACDGLTGCSGAALTAARVSADGRRVEWLRAGALPPVLPGPAGAVLHGPAGPPLGMGDYDESLVTSVTLAPGQRLLFFTDGLVERRGAFTDDGLQRLRAAAGSLDDLAELTEAVCPADQQRDDIAILSWSPLNGSRAAGQPG